MMNLPEEMVQGTSKNNSFSNHNRKVYGQLKGSSDPSQFISKINDGKSRIRHKTTLKLNDEFLDRP